MLQSSDQKLRLLIVDDEENILKSLRRLLRNESYDVSFANSAEEALEIMSDTEVHVLLSDNKMPGMTGIDLVKVVKDKYPESIRILFSGESDMDAVINAVNVGEVYRFILKPWNDIDLRVAISLAFAHWKLNSDMKDLKLHNERLAHLLVRVAAQHPQWKSEIEDVLSQIVASKSGEQAVKA